MVAPFFASNFTSFASDWSAEANLDVTQNATSVTISSADGATHAASTLEDFPIGTLGDLEVSLVLSSSDSDLRVTVSFLDGAGTEIGGYGLFSTNGPGSYAGVGSALPEPPPGTARFRVRIQISSGTATLDHLSMTMAPQSTPPAPLWSSDFGDFATDFAASPGSTFPQVDQDLESTFLFDVSPGPTNSRADTAVIALDQSAFASYEWVVELGRSNGAGAAVWIEYADSTTLVGAEELFSTTSTNGNRLVRSGSTLSPPAGTDGFLMSVYVLAGGWAEYDSLEVNPVH